MESGQESQVSEAEAYAQEDSRADNKAILILMATAVLFALHFVSGWTPQL